MKLLTRNEVHDLANHIHALAVSSGPMADLFSRMVEERRLVIECLAQIVARSEECPFCKSEIHEEDCPIRMAQVLLQSLD